MKSTSIYIDSPEEEIEKQCLLIIKKLKRKGKKPIKFLGNSTHMIGNLNTEGDYFKGIIEIIIKMDKLGQLHGCPLECFEQNPALRQTNPESLVSGNPESSEISNESSNSPLSQSLESAVSENSELSGKPNESTNPPISSNLKPEVVNKMENIKSSKVNENNVSSQGIFSDKPMKPYQKDCYKKGLDKQQIDKMNHYTYWLMEKLEDRFNISFIVSYEICIEANINKYLDEYHEIEAFYKEHFSAKSTEDTCRIC